MRAFRVALATAALLLSGCAGVDFGRTPPVSEAEQRAYDDATSRADTDPARAARQLEDFLRLWPESSLAADAAWQLAGIELARGNDDAALRHFGFILQQDPGSELADRARVRIAQAELRRGNPQAAETALARARISRLPRDDQRKAYRMLADAAEDPVVKLRWLAQLRAAESDDDAVAMLDVEIDERVSQLDLDELDRTAEQLGRQVPAARLRLAAAQIALEQGDLARARVEYERALRLPLAPIYAGRVAVMEERIRLREEGPPEAPELPSFSDLAGRRPPSTDGAVGTLGVVLPLSGSVAHFGQESLQGILLAAGIFDADGDARDGRRVRVLVRDSAGRPERAAAAVHELASREDVTAIIGPLLARECEAAAAAAQAEGIPLLALTAREEIASERPQVFRLRTLPGDQVRLLVDRAMRDGAQTFAVLYPADAYGRGLRALFWDAVEARGGQVVGVASYDPKATDFAEPIRRLVGYTLLGSDEEAAIEEREKMQKRARRLPTEQAAQLREEARALTGPEGQLLPPIVDFDALFIPESHEKVVLIAPQLAFHEAVGMRLLGTDGWYSNDLVSIGGKHVQGAIFTADFYPESELPFVKAFSTDYATTFDAAPDGFAAQGFDAANLVLVQLADGRTSREEIREGLLDTEDYLGVTGVLSMRSDGNAHKRPFLLAVERGRIVQLD